MKVLVFESSAIYRSIIKEIFNSNPNLTLCDFAGSDADFIEKLRIHHPDCISIDATVLTEKEIYRTFNQVQKLKLPSIFFISDSQKNLRTPENVVLFSKPKFESFSSKQIEECAIGLEMTYNQILKKMYSVPSLLHKNDSASQESHNHQIINDMQKHSSSSFQALCIGVSTGGPTTIMELLNGLGSSFPVPIFITQHLDGNFDKNLIEWLQNNVSLPIHFAQDNQIPKNGHVYFTPADVHLTFKKEQNEIVMHFNHDEPVNYLRPAVDKMFDSAAQVFGSKCIAVLLTGMGNDGAEGCVHIKKVGGYTIAQDEKSCVVFGMPKAAIEAGGIDIILNLSEIAPYLKKLVKT